VLLLLAVHQLMQINFVAANLSERVAGTVMNIAFMDLISSLIGLWYPGKLNKLVVETAKRSPLLTNMTHTVQAGVEC